MSKTVDYYRKLPYTILVAPDEYASGEACYFARVAELPGCESHGGTPEEARANLRDALELYVESLLEDGLEPPEPTSAGAYVLWRSSGNSGESVIVTNTTPSLPSSPSFSGGWMGRFQPA